MTRGNGRGGAPGQERATPPFCIERLLEGTLLTHQRSIFWLPLKPCDQDQRPLSWDGHAASTGEGLIAAATRPTARRPSAGDNCDSHAHSPQNTRHATMVRSSHPIDKNFV